MRKRSQRSKRRLSYSKIWPVLSRAAAAVLDGLEAQITELWGHLNAATCRFLALVAEFNRSEAYARRVLAIHA